METGKLGNVGLGAIVVAISGSLIWGGVAFAQARPTEAVSSESTSIAADDAPATVEPKPYVNGLAAEDEAEAAAVLAAQAAQAAADAEAARVAAEIEAARVAAEAEAARIAQAAATAAANAAAKATVQAPTASVLIKCPAGSTANSGDGGNDTSCFPTICFHISLPDPAHPECVTPFKP